MQRLAALLLIGVLVGTSSRAPLLHAHEPAAGNQPDHEHGPAFHEHHQQLLISDGQARVEPADPADTAVAVSFVGPVSPHLRLVAEMSNCAIAVDPPAATGLSRTLTDVRTHGPPRTAPSSPRAPPSFPT